MEKISLAALNAFAANNKGKLQDSASKIVEAVQGVANKRRKGRPELAQSAARLVIDTAVASHSQQAQSKARVGVYQR